MGIPAPNYYSQPVAEGPVGRIAADELLKADLRQKMPELALGNADELPTTYNNAEVAIRIRPDYSERQLDRFEQKLDRKGVFDVPITWREMEVDGAMQKIPLVAATEISENHGDMSSMIYLRDQIQVARSYMELALQDPTRYAEKGDMGRQLLTSAMHLMSTPHQLDRFDAVIKLGSKAQQKDWPFISFHFDDLEATKPNGWRNNQDSFQMLTDAVFDAFNRGFMDVDDLTESHKKFLGSVVPFLESVKFPKHKSSGTWEEYAADRTSVMSVETSMLHKMKKALNGPHAGQLAFLQAEYTEHGGEGVIPYKLDTMVRSGLEELGQRWPYESPDYERRDIKYREADAALTYGLMYDIPDLLEEYQIPIACLDGLPASAITLEHLLLEQLDSLIDPETGSMKRYVRDSYLRRNFLTHEIQANVATIKAHVAKLALRHGTEPNLEMKQHLRDNVVPRGREAAWPHPVAQLSAWAARRQIRAQNLGQSFEAERYHRLSIKYLNQAARSITGTQQYHVVRQEDGSYGVQQVAAFRVPEAMVTYSDKKGDLIVPSPHTQLNWAAATMGEAFKLCRAAAHGANAHYLGQFSVRQEEAVTVAA
jgi:hypothetical protein